MKTNSLLMIALSLTLLFSATSQAATPECQEFPEILGASGISGAVTGLPFTFDVRLSCLLGEKFELVGLQGQYQSPEGHSLPAYIAIPTFPLPNGNLLYQFLFSIPDDQPQGIYTLEGCVLIREKDSDRSVCLPVSESMRVRSRAPWL